MALDKDTWVSLQIQDNGWALTCRNPLSLPNKTLAALICTHPRHSKMFRTK